ncbi:hypothetical protein T10_11754 [Trichinella papuae]|uniref:Uncharacterized protein n=1 Tax=Trichinella papuae TaxID=268474 RepID=A0A0V1MDR2_9BILA|nr:hypothetical protein T10_11754 [Trichinella papuae]
MKKFFKLPSGKIKENQQACFIQLLIEHCTQLTSCTVCTLYVTCRGGVCVRSPNLLTALCPKPTSIAFSCCLNKIRQ